jgi:hypothetical protein
MRWGNRPSIGPHTAFGAQREARIRQTDPAATTRRKSAKTHRRASLSLREAFGTNLDWVVSQFEITDYQPQFWSGMLPSILPHDILSSNTQAI